MHIADEYDSLTAWRPYRDPWDPLAAITEIRQDSEVGRVDPEMAEVFCALIQKDLAERPSTDSASKPLKTLRFVDQHHRNALANEVPAVQPRVVQPIAVTQVVQRAFVLRTCQDS